MSCKTLVFYMKVFLMFNRKGDNISSFCLSVKNTHPALEYDFSNREGNMPAGLRLEIILHHFLEQIATLPQVLVDHLCR